MAANTNPIFVKAPHIEWGIVQSANTNKDGTGLATFVFTAGTEGSRIEKIRIANLGTNENCVLRLFVNNGQSNAIADNNALIEELNMSAYSNSNTTAQTIIEYSWEDGLVLPAGYRLMAAVSSNLTSGLKITVFGGDF